MAVLALVSCEKKEFAGTEKLNEMSFTSMLTKGYAEGDTFFETVVADLHNTSATKTAREMQISAYLYPQNGEQGNYFVGKTYAQSAEESHIWWNVEGGQHVPIYWPVGGTLDFLAYSLSAEAATVQSVDVEWNAENAASQVVLAVPAENSQNDILFASAYGIKAPSTAAPVPMQFNHAQAWLEFVLTGSEIPDDNATVHFKRIELENVYNAGTLNITNNGGNAIAKWDFSNADKQTIEVDNFNENLKLSGSPKYLDMLIPEQAKTAFVLYYTLGNDEQELSYRFTTDLKTWFKGEKYIYKINITTSEVTVEPKTAPWNSVSANYDIN